MFIAYKFKGKKDYKKLLIPTVIIYLAFIIFRFPVMMALNVKQADFVESMSIPLQQVAYVIRNDGKISDEDLNEIKKIADVDKIIEQKENPISKIKSDYVKDNIRENDKDHYLEKNKLKFLSIYLNIGISNPVQYIKAYIIQTNGFWYHNVDPYVVYIVDTDLRGKDEGYKFEFTQENLLPKGLPDVLPTLLTKTTEIYYKTWSPSMALYLTFIALYVIIKKKENYMHLIVNIGIFISLLFFTPVSCEFRYAYSIFLTGFIYLILSLINKGEKSER